MADEQALKALMAGVEAWSRFRSDHSQGQESASRIDLSDAELPNPDLPYANPSLPYADLSNVNLRYARLANADLTGANLTNAYLASVDLTGANLTNANLTNAYMASARLTGANLTSANLTAVNLSHAHLEDMDLHGVDLTGVYFFYTQLARANLSAANLHRVDLTGADLTRADLTRADLSETTLRDADLGEANLTDANLIRADITDAVFTNAKLTNAYVAGLRMSPDTVNTQGIKIGDLLSSEQAKTVQPDVPDPGIVRIALPELRTGIGPAELAGLSNAIAVIAELSERVGVELGRRLSGDIGNGGTAVLISAAGDSFAPIVVQRVQYGSPLVVEVWDAVWPYLATGGVGATAGIVVKSLRDGSADAGRVWSLLLTFARPSERQAYFAARTARAEANAAEEEERRARAEANTAEHQARRDLAAVTGSTAQSVGEQDTDILRLEPSSRTEIVARLNDSDISNLIPDAELEGLADVIAQLLSYPVVATRRNELPMDTTG
ncbi:pentapeptide repeat-containing protein [Rhodococcus sp. 14-2483-1-2]|uniref:pentapeptide repeat-containing protein n=1 Tax=Rhodococcus sp. 14-2483-1-2 TaxID=2023147 RepID=UPI000B9B7E27|nr:pentapeptide repeat-containing protein [Rhodococcus sp. 14-2483-1-2]OZF38242.1 hypothetical protein CH295_04350 [Rhodococcus sp. 14-2483-1-2]